MAHKDEQKVFLDFYQTGVKRLSAIARAYNRSLKKDPNPILRIFKEDLADLNEGGKMLRGVLVGLGLKLAGETEIEKSDYLALAFELFQTGVLIHDDIIDNAETRRGKFTIHRRYEHRLDDA